MEHIIGHVATQKRLERLLSLSDRPQSFLFAGPRHIGKRPVALWFAERLIQSTTPKNKEQNLLIIEPEATTSSKQQVREKLISVDAIRTAQQFLMLSPTQGKQRVLIVDDAEKLGMGAVNALLKILEEPPQLSSIILLTAEPGRLPSTLLSRLIPFYFRPLERESLQQAWPGATTLPQFFLDLGLPGIVFEALNTPEVFNEKKNWLRQLFQLSKLSLRERLTLAESLAKNQSLTRDMLEIWCVGLIFQLRDKKSDLAPYYLFLENILKTLGQFSRGEGSPRVLLEKLFIGV